VVLAAEGQRLVVADLAETKDDLVPDMVEVFTSFCARLYPAAPHPALPRKPSRRSGGEDAAGLPLRAGPELLPAPAARKARRDGAFAWNWALAGRIGRYQAKEGSARFTSAIEHHRELTARKATEWPWMYEVSKCAPQEALRDLERAFRNLVRARKAGRYCGFPRFKRKGVNDSFRLNGSIHVAARGVRVPRLGSIRTKESTQKFRGRILSATVRREADRWYVSLTVEVERPEPPARRGSGGGSRPWAPELRSGLRRGERGEDRGSEALGAPPETAQTEVEGAQPKEAGLAQSQSLRAAPGTAAPPYPERTYGLPT
jgi:hypothetical protein